jgi:hypothetical protein
MLGMRKRKTKWRRKSGMGRKSGGGED